MSPIRVAVIGVGHLGYHHARNYAGLDGVELVGVVDTDDTNGAKAANDFQVPHFHDVKDVLALGIDAASVVVPTTLHHEMTLRLIDAGVDVLVEKPIAQDVENASHMVTAAHAAGRILQVGHIERFNGAVRALFDAVERPRFIECHRLSPYPNRGHDVSVVLDLMIHDLEIVLAMDGTQPESVDGVGVPVFSKYEDIANARIRFASGCVANLTCSRVSMDRMRKIRVFAPAMYASTDYSAEEVLIYRKMPGELAPGQNPMDLITVESLSVQHEEPLRLELASFIDCVRERTRPVVNGEDALNALKLAQQIIDSMRETP
ncbi:MAG TPA: Gfo/Idh/MocA family oxidoreductase [Candidatus Hydrogenedentes bacterium]|nr:Gfo/Idh/MocA family oxidoreductase [Candidatus Hydrogenedentota bacterium]HQE83564.1 Gfo/Idh/MocA family oxidoreductase [Candidatus Hydrogenedentota bacterium]HQH51233.1 Gfo/Idh/MocA family oxidoreductase [Candidatus Hydrogenedentota bacterium]HQM47313.1 Gfo/Idh/MocA family oxidoreductase [Candidatus Hydrogenedentota bacterium]